MLSDNKPNLEIVLSFTIYLFTKYVWSSYYVSDIILNSGSQPGVMLLPWEHFSMSSDIFGC